jgi:hypothetical protein
MRYFLFLSLLMCACSGDTSLPKDVLPKEKMQQVLYDVIKADEMVDFRKYSDSTYNAFSKRTAFYDTIFQLHGVRKETFQKSLHFYQGRPDLLRDIIEAMNKKVSDTSNTSKKSLNRN